LKEKELNLIFDVFFKKYKINFPEFIELKENPQKQEYIIRDFFVKITDEIKKLKDSNEYSENFLNFIDDYKIIVENSSKVVEDFVGLCDKYSIYSKLPANMEKLFQIFRVISNKSTYNRFFHILSTFSQDADSYPTRRELEKKLSPILGSSIKNLPNDLKQLRIHKLIKKKGIRYHLSKFGVLFFKAILSLEKDLQPSLVKQLSRAIFLHSIYEGEGLDIRTHQHIQQIGFLIEELIQESIEKDEVLEWIPYLEGLNEIIEDLDALSELYKDEPHKKQVILKVKAKIAYELSRFHEATKHSLYKYLSLVERGFYPNRMKKALNFFNLKSWQRLETLFDFEMFPSPLPEIESNLITVIIDGNKKSEFKPEIDVKNSIRTEIFNIENANKELDLFIPNYKILRSKLLTLNIKNGFLISELIPKWRLNWVETANLIANLPTILEIAPILCYPLKNIEKIKNGSIKDGFLILKEFGKIETRD